MANKLNIQSSHLEYSYEGTLDASLGNYYQAKIDEAVRLLMRKVPNLPARITHGEVDPDLVTDIIVRAVLRVVRNADGAESENAGGYGYKLNPMVASGDIWFPDTDLSLITDPYLDLPRAVRITSSPGWSQVDPRYFRGGW